MLLTSSLFLRLFLLLLLSMLVKLDTRADPFVLDVLSNSICLFGPTLKLMRCSVKLPCEVRSYF